MIKIGMVVEVPENPKELLKFEKKVKILYELGYDGVDLNIRDPTIIDREKIWNILSRYEMEVGSILTGKAFSIDKLSLTDPDESVRKKALKRIKDHISLATYFSAIVLIGWIRGNWQGSDYSRKLFIESLRECSREAENKGVKLGIEPINRHEIDSINTICEAIKLLKEANLPNTGIIADTYHMGLEEEEPIYESIIKCKDYLLHIHIADSDRKIPGEGNLPLKEFFEVLKKIGYQGFVSVELPSSFDLLHTAKKSIEYINKCLNLT